ncbi:hypothetical protein HD554DRAFT_2068384 [Boletus coccyginus]|nr:hypothetical protein HD554DRAFT_2068384 [Boletus coccyginus]
MEDLDEAIVLNRKALDLFPQGHPNWSTSLNNLASCLTARYDQLGRWMTREALDLFPLGHPNRAVSFNNLVHHLFTRYDQLGGMDDLDDATLLGREALDSFPRGHPD